MYVCSDLVCNGGCMSALTWREHVHTSTSPWHVPKSYLTLWIPDDWLSHENMQKNKDKKLKSEFFLDRGDMYNKLILIHWVASYIPWNELIYPDINLSIGMTFKMIYNFHSLAENLTLFEFFISYIVWCLFRCCLMITLIAFNSQIDFHFSFLIAWYLF